MQSFKHKSRQRVVFGLVTCGVVFVMTGCGGPKLLPVSGKVYVNGELISRGTVHFKPDQTKGNQSGDEPFGEIGPDGTYSLITHNSSAAPPGAYKVIVFYDKPLKTPRDIAESLLPPKYKDPKTTPLAVQVVAKPDPGAYDLKIEADPKAPRPRQTTLPPESK